MKKQKDRFGRKGLIHKIPILEELKDKVGIEPLAENPDAQGILRVKPLYGDNGVSAGVILQIAHANTQGKLGYYLEILDGKIKFAKSFYTVIAEKSDNPNFMSPKEVYLYYKKKLGEEPVAIYDYSNAEGKLIYQVLRYESDGGKDFKQRRPDGKGGWIWNLKGVERVPYNLPNVVKADMVWIVEGEKNVKDIETFGLVGSCNNGGAGNWQVKLAPHFRGKEIIILPDKDQAGENHANQVAWSLRQVAKSIKIINLPNLPDKGDVSDWIAAGGTREELLVLAAEAPEWSPPIGGMEAGSTRSLCGNIYAVEGRALSVLDDHGFVPLCNFQAQIDSEIYRDDGLIARREFVISGSTQDGVNLPPIVVPAKEFDSLQFLRREWGAKVAVAPKHTLRCEVPNAIIALSPSHQQRTIYSHTGFRNINGVWCYLHAGGAIGGPPGVEVELERELARYRLPAPGDAEAARASLNFLKVGSARLTVPLLAFAYLAPIADNDLFKIDFLLWLYGRTGEFKSTIAALLLCHFGYFDRTTLPGSWLSTANALEQSSHALKDCLYVVDDFNPPSDPREAFEMRAKAGRLIYQVGNRSGRGRLAPDLTRRPTYYPRGLIISTGEMMLPGQRQSATARCLAIKIDRQKVTVNRDLLTRAQAERGLYAQAMSAYIAKIVPKYEETLELAYGLFLNYRNYFQGTGHARVPEVMAWLMVGFELFLHYQTEMGVINPDESDEKLEDAWKVLEHLGKEHARQIDSERPSQMFVEVLRELFIQGRIYVEDVEGGPPRLLKAQGWQGVEPTKNAEFLGWCDRSYLFILPETTIRVVKEAIQRQGGYLALGKNDLLATLSKEGIIERDKHGRNTPVKKIRGSSQRVIWLRLEALKEKDEDEDDLEEPER